MRRLGPNPSTKVTISNHFVAEKLTLVVLTVIDCKLPNNCFDTEMTVRIFDLVSIVSMLLYS